MNLDHLANADELKQIREDREPRYGPHLENYTNLGLVWGGILRAAGWTPPGDDNGVQPDVCELMMSGAKIVRAANERGNFLADNYNDAVNYTQMAGELKRDREDVELIIKQKLCDDRALILHCHELQKKVTAYEEAQQTVIGTELEFRCACGASQVHSSCSYERLT